MAVGVGHCSTAFDVHSLHETRTAREFHLRDENVPKGLDAIYGVCSDLYRNQRQPQQVEIYFKEFQRIAEKLNKISFQVAAKVKHWMGGPDPLDFVSVYYNCGNPSACVEPHWHYVSMGLSDLYGDGRVFRSLLPNYSDTGSGQIERVSGFGFELTFRLRKENSDTVI